MSRSGEAKVLVLASGIVWALLAVAPRTRFFAGRADWLADSRMLVIPLVLQLLIVLGWFRAPLARRAWPVARFVRDVARARREPILVAGPLVLALALIACDLFSSHLLSVWASFVAAGLYLLAASLWLAHAFNLHRAARRGSSFFLCSSVVLAALALSDVSILLFRSDTSGPGSSLSFTHRTWLDRYVTNNAAGFWERELTPYLERVPSRTVIATVGDSFTYGQGVPGHELRFSERLEEKLRASSGRDVRVLNFARPGGTTRTEKEWVEKHVVTVHPDVVMVFYLSNDIEALEVAIPSPTPFKLGRATTTVLRASPTANFLYWKLVGPALYASSGEAYFSNLMAAYNDPTACSAHHREVDELIGAIRALGARPVFVILPFPHMWQHVPPKDQRRIYDALLARATKAGAATLDLSFLEARFPPAEFQVNSGDGHPNARVHAGIADEVHAWLQRSPELLAPSVPR